MESEVNVYNCTSSCIHELTVINHKYYNWGLKMCSVSEDDSPVILVEMFILMKLSA